MFQSTLPRRERQIAEQEQMIDMTVSIHAPAKGATMIECNYSEDYIVSIHAPAKGATYQRGKYT